MRLHGAVALVGCLVLLGGCGQGNLEGEASVCEQAVAHIQQCTGMVPVMLVESCDPALASFVLSQDCSGTQRSIQSSDGGWWNDLLCRLGFYQDCDSKQPEQPAGRGTPTPFPDGPVDLTGYRSDTATRKAFVQSFGAARYAEYSDVVHDTVAQHPYYGPVPTEDLVAVRGYTSDVPEGSGSTPDYSQMNGALRKQDAAELARLAAYIKCASSGLNQLAVFPGTTYRRTNLPDAILATYQKGSTVTERAFTSSSIVLLDTFQGNTIFLITSWLGREVTELSVFPEEREILFVPGTRFRVTLVDRQTQAGTTMISMEEVR